MDYHVDIHQYTIKAQLGQGSFANVYLVSHNGSGKLYAAKVLHNINFGDSLHTFRNEIRCITKCSSKTLIKFYGFSEQDFLDNNLFTLFFKYMEKGSLEDLISQASKGQAKDIVDNTCLQIILIGIAHGMMKLHEKNIIHRDLKPSNVLLDDFYHPRISDFGLSISFEKHENRSSSFAQDVGTLFYMAPELLRNETFDSKIDVYAFGILMYSVLTFKPPYIDKIVNRVQKSQFILRIDKAERPKYDKMIKHSLYDLCAQCWKPVPHERPSFPEIYAMLSTGQDPVLKGKGDYPYFLDGVDIDKINEYIDYITSEPKPGRVSVEEFNLLTEKYKDLDEKFATLKKQSDGVDLLQGERIQDDIRNCKAELDMQQAQLSLIRRQLNILKKQQSSMLNSDPIDSFERMHILAANLTNVTIPRDIKRIPYGMFYNCVNLHSVTISNSVTIIEESAFSGCTGLTELIIPSSVTLIAKNAFSNCIALEVVVIPQSVVTIEDYAFRNCTSLTTVSLHSQTQLGIDVFDGCTKLNLKMRKQES